MYNETLSFLSCRFHHPEAEKISNPCQEMEIKEPHKGIQLHDIKCKLTFVSNPREINNLLLGCPPMISVCDTAEGHSNQLAIATVDIGPLFRMVSNCLYFLTSVRIVSLHGSEREQTV
jgi:hypothetical protein